MVKLQLRTVSVKFLEDSSLQIAQTQRIQQKGRSYIAAGAQTNGFALEKPSMAALNCALASLSICA